MDIWITAIRLALQALFSYKVRTVLTMLGIIIGIGSVIMMMSIGRGANAQVQEQFNKMGSNLMFIFSGSTKKGGVRGGHGSKPTLRVKDAEAIRANCPSVETVTYFVSRNVQIAGTGKNWGTRAFGVTPEYRIVRNRSLREGEFISYQHMKSASSVVVLGSTVANSLFESGEQIIGRKIRIRNFPFTVIGIMNKLGTSPGGRDQDDQVMIPYTTAMRKLINNRLPGMVHLIMVSAKSRGLILQAKQEIEQVLRQRHRILPNQDDDFSVRTLDEFATRAEEANKTMAFFFIAVATISLLVGGIGIMNIMLASVTERTREIGIRIAVGARERDVLVQFLVESTTMSIAGGVLGTLVGIGVAKGISALAQWPTIVTLDSILLATLFSGAVGIFFGFFPARKASRLDPIQALSYE